MQLFQTENNIGVQYADFIPGTCIRALNGKPDFYNLYRSFQKKIYNGIDGDNDRFGLKKLLS